jgi:putative sterol carrier protein
VARYLSPEWFDEMSAAAAQFQPESPRDASVSLRQVISGTPFGDVNYVMTIEPTTVSISRDSDVNADVTFSQDYETASQLHRGELTTHDAFFQGRVRVGGHLNTLLDNADLLQGIAPAFASVRASTTYE